MPLPQPLPSLAEVASYRIQGLNAAGGEAGEQSLLVVQALPDGSSRWIQTDALGAPLARQVLQQGQWRNDGFLPPNRAASRLFAALMSLQIPSAQLQRHYPDLQVRIQAASGQEQRQFSRQQQTLWRTERRADGTVLVEAADLGRWLVQPLPEADPAGAAP